MKQILAVGTLMVICAMLGAFLRDIERDQPKPIWFMFGDRDAVPITLSDGQEMPTQDCRKWSPMDAHPNCKPELCPTVEDETQMVCR